MWGWYVMRLNSGKMSRTYTNKSGVTKKRFINMLPPGTPDLFALKKGRVAFIEVKKPGNKPTYLQEEKMKELQSYGAVCLIARDPEDLEPLKDI